ncbi:MAG TPA: dTDP-4-dehydrorhamnose reductase, partial [Pyrinomonadaceae bacterium]|nr:dTDP-4-dehydrorhamnose reductase [Pyrinomonadaceae bacterium]
EAVRATLRDLTPQAVINCAAYTDVDGAESNIDTSYRANSTGPANLAAACRDAGIELVTISTDYVFDGEKDGFYTEDDLPKPQGVYAKSKFEGEQQVAEANPDAVIVRTGWIYGPGGTNFLSVMHRLLADGRKIKAIEDATGTPTFAVDLAARLRELASTEHSGIFHITNSGEGTTYLGFANAVCEIGGFDKNLIERIKNSDLQRPAPRPVNSRLACERASSVGLAPLPEWRDALGRFIASEMKKAAA